MWSHNHPPNEPPCRERRLPGGGVRGECLLDEPAREAPALPLADRELEPMGTE